ncbi:hypothetical protein GH733_016617, partial [Mirounga leonina]
MTSNMDPFKLRGPQPMAPSSCPTPTWPSQPTAFALPLASSAASSSFELLGRQVGNEIQPVLCFSRHGLQGCVHPERGFLRFTERHSMGWYSRGDLTFAKSAVCEELTGAHNTSSHFSSSNPLRLLPHLLLSTAFCCAVAQEEESVGAITFQGLQKTGDSPASDHLFPPTSGLVYSTPSDHIALHSGHSPPDLSKSTETHKLKHHCNTTHRFKPTYNPIDNSQNSTSHQEVPPTSEKNPSNQGKDPNVQNEHSVDPTDSTNTHKGRHKTTSAHINITRSLGNPVENGKGATLPYKKNPGVPAEPTKHGEETKSTNEKTTTTKEKSKKHGQNSTPSSRKTTRASEESRDHEGKTTRALEGPKDHGGKTTGAPEGAPEGSKDHGGKTTGAPEASKDHGEKTLANGKTTRTPKGSKDHGGKTTLAIGSFILTTSHMELSSTMSETPGNKSHPYQNKDGSQRGLHAGGIRENDSFPAWAIVIVVLVAVILFLMFLGLIILVSYMMKTRHALIQNKEDNDPEDDGGPNSYSVHLMEQQTLGMGQIASP